MLHVTAQVVWPEYERETQSSGGSSSGQVNTLQIKRPVRASPPTLGSINVVFFFSFPTPCVCTDVEAYGRALFALIMRGRVCLCCGGVQGTSLSQWQLILHDQSRMN